MCNELILYCNDTKFLINSEIIKFEYIYRWFHFISELKVDENFLSFSYFGRTSSYIPCKSSISSQFGKQTIKLFSFADITVRYYHTAVGL